jgi:hypothetical protein
VLAISMSACIGDGSTSLRTGNVIPDTTCRMSLVSALAVDDGLRVYVLLKRRHAGRTNNEVTVTALNRF